MADSGHDSPTERLTQDAVRLIEHLRSAAAPPEAVAEARRHIRDAMQALAPHLRRGTGWSALTIANDPQGVAWREDDLGVCMPYSPVCGARNPVAPVVRMWKNGDEVGGEATFSSTYAGPPDSVHGGIIAAVFDELLSMANVVRDTAGFTGTLSVRYHRRTPLNTPVELWARNERSEGRKLLCRAEFRVGGEVTASAEGLFIVAGELSDMPAGGRR